jgi:hypothetical protein
MDKLVPAFIDLEPNVLKHPVGGKFHKKQHADFLRADLESKIVDCVNRYASLPALVVHEGEYRKLLIEARNLFTYGYFYSCVAMCGISAERILKDIFVGRFSVVSKGQTVPPNAKSKKALESFSAKSICDFLAAAGFFDKTLQQHFAKLASLRNKYAHAGGKNAETDAREAINHLHAIVQGTVSIQNV